MLQLAASEGVGDVQRAPSTMTAQQLADAQGLPRKFLEAILSDLRRADLLYSQRGAEGGYRLTRKPTDINVGDVIRAVDGPLAEVRGQRPELATYSGSSEHLRILWIATRAAVRHVLDETSLADVVLGDFPTHVRDLITSPDAWERR